MGLTLAMVIVRYGQIYTFTPLLRKTMRNPCYVLGNIPQEAERRELEIIAFTDHNSVHRDEQMRQDIDFLQTLERAQRLTEEQQIV